jgi:hypothetical protein
MEDEKTQPTQEELVQHNKLHYAKQKLKYKPLFQGI